MTLKHTIIALAPAAAAVMVALTPAAGTGPDPSTAYGTNPVTAVTPTYHVDDHDEVDTSGGFVDQAF